MAVLSQSIAVVHLMDFCTGSIIICSRVNASALTVSASGF